MHSIQISKDRRLFVVDRGHRRIQVFDENGKFLDMWTTGMRSSPYAHLITTDQVALGVGWRDAPDPQVRPERKLSSTAGAAPAATRDGSMARIRLTVDQDGNLYLAEVFGGRVQKFRPKPGADPAKVVGPENRYQGGKTND